MALAYRYPWLGIDLLVALILLGLALCWLQTEQLSGRFQISINGNPSSTILRNNDSQLESSVVGPVEFGIISDIYSVIAAVVLMAVVTLLPLGMCMRLQVGLNRVDQ